MLWHQAATTFQRPLSYVIPAQISAPLVHLQFSALKAPNLRGKTGLSNTVFNKPCFLTGFGETEPRSELNGSTSEIYAPSAALSHWPPSNTALQAGTT